MIAQRYRLGRKLGEGGMGAVYEAEHVVTGKRVAVKVLEQRESLPPEAVDRFLREARAPAAIGHPNVVDVLDAGREPDGTAFIVMELLEGETLDGVLEREGVLQPPALAAIMDQLLGALDAMHARGFVHRDLKPANIFLARTPSEPMRVKLLDFGIAKALGEESRTRSGYVIGTPAYMAPEQMRSARAATPRSDLWSVGVILYECLVGHRPYRGETFSLLAQIAGPGTHASLASIAPHVPADLAGLVDALLSKDPAARPAGAAVVRAALLPLLAHCPPVHPITPHDEVETAAEGLGLANTERSSQPGTLPWSGPPAGSEALPRTRRKPGGPDRRIVLLAGAAAVLTAGVAFAMLARRGNDTGPRAAISRPTASTPPATAQGTPVATNPALGDFLHRWLGTVLGSQGRSPVTAYYADPAQFRESSGLASPPAIQRYWSNLFATGGSFVIDWERSTWQEEPADLNAGVSAACINLVGATGRVLKVRAWATEVRPDRSSDIGCPRLEGVYLLRLRHVGGALKICHETWSLREGICASCPTAQACQGPPAAH